MRKLTSHVITFIMVALCMPLVVVSVSELGQYIGLQKMPVPVVGTGSMYPSLFWEKSEGGPDDSTKLTVEEYRTTPHMYRRFAGLNLAGNKYFYRPINYGDMVAFANDKTRAILEKEGKDPGAGFIKRVIGMPGDTLELRDGYVYKNGQLLDEPYIYRPRSTYGDKDLGDCVKLTIPPGQYMVLGDNRKVSSDSRSELGLISDTDINFVLPYGEQQQYVSLWRDTSQDQELIGTSTLDSNEFYQLVNAERASRQLSSLKVNAALALSSEIKGEKFLEGNKNYDLKTSLSVAGYHNIISGEFVTLGHYSAEELIKNLMYFKNTQDQLMDKRYQDIGVVAVNRVVNDCPSQVIVGHLGGYIPASYDRKVVSSWEESLSNLEKVVSSWEKAQDYPDMDQTLLNQLLSILNRRLSLAREIVGIMHDNKWLSDDLEARIDKDPTDAREADRLIKILNKE